MFVVISLNCFCDALILKIVSLYPKGIELESNSEKLFAVSHVFPPAFVRTANKHHEED